MVKSFREWPISLAAGVMHQTTDPVESAKAAIASGWDGIGFWIDPKEWTSAWSREILALTRDTRLEILDVEALLIKPGPFDDSMFTALDVGLALGSKNYIVASYDYDHGAVAEKLSKLCRHVGKNMDITLEFIPHSGVKTCDAAQAILRQIDLPNATMMIDPLHVRTGGMGPADIRRVDPKFITYAQLCDIGPVRTPIPNLSEVWPEEMVLAFRREAWDERLIPGEGVLPLKEFLKVLPHSMPLSIELRSKPLRETYPDPYARAKVLADATRAWLEALEG